MNNNYLVHYGVLGMKWGVRRYQNPDGSLTAAGRKKYNRLEKTNNNLKTASRVQGALILNKRSEVRSKISNKYDKKINAVQRDIDSYTPIKDGLKDKKGRDIFTKEDVSFTVNELKKLQDEYKKRKRYKLDDHDLGTKYIREGLKKHQSILDNYKDVKIKVLSGQMDKKSPEYKKAIKEYTYQVMRDVNHYGDISASILKYSADYRIADKNK